MKAKELLLECKVRLKVSTDYALAKALNIPDQRISDYMKGTRTPDNYAAFRIAEALGRDPALVIAELSAEEGGKHVEYFRDFLQRRGLLELVGVSLLIYSASYAPEANAASSFETSHNVYYVKS